MLYNLYHFITAYFVQLYIMAKNKLYTTFLYGIKYFLLCNF